MTCGKKYYFLEEHSDVEQTNSITDYLPDDETFVAKNISGTNTRNMLQVFGNQLKLFEEITNVFTNEMSPECADQLMGEWERMLGIPDSCFSVEGQTLDTRRRNALIKLAKMSVQTTEDFTILAQAFGITATVQSGIDYVNAGGTPFPGGDTEARFTIVITFLSEVIDNVFTLTFPFTFGLEILGILECVFRKVIPANCNVLFIEEFAEVLGDLYFALGEPATSFRNSYFGTAEGTLDSDIAIEIGAKITFSYTANNGIPLDNENFIESSDGVNFFGFETSGPSVGFSSFVGYTATLNGVPITSGDPIPYASASNYPVGGTRLTHIIVLTATVATDIRFIGTANIGQPIYDVVIGSGGQVWRYPIDSTSTVNPDSEGSGNDLVLSNNTFIVNYPVMFNTGDDIGNIAPYLVIETPNFGYASNNFNYAVASMRTDTTGAALGTNGSTHWFGSGPTGDILVPYKDGFTIEVIARFIGAVSSSGRACGIVSATSNAFGQSLWAIGFDDYDGSAGGSGTVVPKFNMITRNTLFHQSSTASSVAEIAGSAAVSNNIYHLLATIRPSDNSIEFWVNGVSVGSTTITQGDMDDWMFGNSGEFGAQDVKNGIFGTRFDIGARLTNGAWRSGQDSHIQDLKVHLLEADDAFAEQQAANANFT